jgi:thiamine-monophosphate kinase
LSLSLPRANEQWLSGFASGLFELAKDYNVALVGGDTVRGPLVITVQIAGWVESDGWLTRSGAKPGDLLFVSGIPGEAAGGLAVIQRRIMGGESASFLKHRFLRPRARIELGRQLRNFATAAMDVSDGLLTDLKKLCAASGCGAQLNVDALPESPAMRELFEADDCWQYALAGGDDYELLFTLSPQRAATLRTLQLQQRVTQIGVITGDASVLCLREGQPFRVKRGGYDHFANSNDAG